MNTPLVSISCITYNHAPFIRQCLDGFLMQRCNFPIEIIINDDCSTDGTTEIIREYAAKYPDKIFPIIHNENQWSKGIRCMSQKFVFPKARGKYIALCEGDDYWTDPLKLQKQVDFLESHPDYSMCFHKAEVIAEGGREYRNPFKDLEEREYYAEDVIPNWLVPTATILFNKNIVNVPRHDDFKVGDMVIVAACLAKGRLYCMNAEMSAYRLHSGGWTATCNCQSDGELTSIRHRLALFETFPGSVMKPLKYSLAVQYIHALFESLQRKEFYVIRLLPRILYYCNWCLLYIIIRFIIKNKNIKLYIY